MSATFTVDHNRKKGTISLISRYKPVGIVDGCPTTEFSNDQFSLLNKQSAVQRSASLLKIQNIRKYYDKLIKRSPRGTTEDAKVVPDSSMLIEDHPFTRENQQS